MFTDGFIKLLNKKMRNSVQLGLQMPKQAEWSPCCREFLSMGITTPNKCLLTMEMVGAEMTRLDSSSLDSLNR
jgi:hypothetical protein